MRTEKEINDKLMHKKGFLCAIEKYAEEREEHIKALKIVIETLEWVLDESEV